MSNMIDILREWNRIFDFDKDVAKTEVMFNKMINAIDESRVKMEENLPYYFGYQIIVNSDRKAHVYEFGNKAHELKESIKKNNVREPLVDKNFNAKENTYVITAEMPGVAKEDIRINVSQNSVKIEAEHGDKKYESQIHLDMELKDFSTKTSYTNGILELKIKVKELPEQKPKEIKVE